jgi:lysozyme
MKVVGSIRPGTGAMDIIKHFEQGPDGGHATVKYRCSANKWTIGWGHVILTHEKFQEPMTRAIADALLDRDLAVTHGRTRDLLSSYGVTEIEQHQYDALLCLAFNVGTGVRDNVRGDFADSTLLHYVGQNRMTHAADEFSKWVYGGGKVLPGLVRRRKCERFLFQTGQVNFFEAK